MKKLKNDASKLTERLSNDLISFFHEYKQDKTSLHVSIRVTAQALLNLFNYLIDTKHIKKESALFYLRLIQHTFNISFEDIVQDENFSNFALIQEQLRNEGEKDNDEEIVTLH